MISTAPRSSTIASAQKHLQADRYAPAENTENTEGEGDVRRHRYAPPGSTHRAEVDERVDRCGDDHPAQRRGYRESRLAERRKFADQELSLDFQSHQKEEQRHDTVVDPVME